MAAGTGATAAPTNPTTSVPSVAYRVPPHVLNRLVDDDMVLLDLKAEQYYGLNHVGARIFTMVVEMPVDEAVTTLSRCYDVVPETLQDDVRQLLDALVLLGLLHPTAEVP